MASSSRFSKRCAANSRTCARRVPRKSVSPACARARSSCAAASKWNKQCQALLTEIEAFLHNWDRDQDASGKAHQLCAVTAG